MSNFDDALDGVAQPGFIDIKVTRKKYPIPDPGSYHAAVTAVNLFESPYDDKDPNAKIMKLSFEIQNEGYIDDNGEKRKYRVFSKPYSFSFGPRSSLTNLCTDLTGRPPLFAERKEKDGANIVLHRRFNPQQFCNMECEIVVKHVESKGNIYANIAAILTNNTQKKENCKFLPVTSEEQEISNARNSLARASKEAGHRTGMAIVEEESGGHPSTEEQMEQKILDAESKSELRRLAVFFEGNPRAEKMIAERLLELE